VAVKSPGPCWTVTIPGPRWHDPSSLVLVVDIPGRRSQCSKDSQAAFCAADLGHRAENRHADSLVIRLDDYRIAESGVVTQRRCISMRPNAKAPVGRQMSQDTAVYKNVVFLVRRELEENQARLRVEQDGSSVLAQEIWQLGRRRWGLDEPLANREYARFKAHPAVLSLPEHVVEELRQYYLKVDIINRRYDVVPGLSKARIGAIVIPTLQDARQLGNLLIESLDRLREEQEMAEEEAEATEQRESDNAGRWSNWRRNERIAACALIVGCIVGMIGACGCIANWLGLIPLLPTPTPMPSPSPSAAPASPTLARLEELPASSFTAVPLISPEAEPTQTPEQLTATPGHTASVTPPAVGGGGRIAFASNRGGDFELYITNPYGGNVGQLTYNRGRDDYSPAWSPDANRIAFARGYLDSPKELRVTDGEPTGPDHQWSEVRATHHSMIMRPGWSPDGSAILFEMGDGADKNLACVMSEGSAAPVQLTIAGGEESGADWSPDGQTIAFAGTGGQGTYGCDALYLYQLQIGECTTAAIAAATPQAVLDGDGHMMLGGCNGGVRWSPHGDALLFIRRFQDGTPQGRYGIYTVNRDGSGLHRVVDDSRELFLGDWSPDGTMVVFARIEEPGNTEVYLVEVDGTGLRRVTTSPADDRDPSWSPS